MFTKNSLKTLKVRLLEKVKDVNGSDLFQWIVECNIIPNDKAKKHPTIQFDQKKMPQPTDYIRSEISKKDLKRIRRKITTVVDKQSYTIKKIFDLTIVRHN